MFLIAQGADVNARDKRGRTPLFDSVETGYFSQTQFLLENGADANARDNSGVGAIDIAKKRDHRREVKLLREYGAKENDSVHVPDSPLEHYREEVPIGPP